ncbi:Shufflon-specific DNA recombinase [Escherichia coli]|uniref:Shufflon-specific DNA recombinase n=1 Tax=Escherichia coli TaxID=562 RepID=A0A376VWH3_ECOLX|nr:Shufflon-specific DNA recombinase [Escherichia coli]
MPAYCCCAHWHRRPQRGERVPTPGELPANIDERVMICPLNKLKAYQNEINYKFRINLITVLLSQLLIQIYMWHNIPVSDISLHPLYSLYPYFYQVWPSVLHSGWHMTVTDLSNSSLPKANYSVSTIYWRIQFFNIIRLCNTQQFWKQPYDIINKGYLQC